MENLDYLSVVFLQKGNKVSTNKSDEYFFFLGYREFILHDIKKESLL